MPHHRARKKLTRPAPLTVVLALLAAVALHVLLDDSAARGGGAIATANAADGRGEIGVFAIVVGYPSDSNSPCDDSEAPAPLWSRTGIALGQDVKGRSRFDALIGPLQLLRDRD